MSTKTITIRRHISHHCNLHRSHLLIGLNMMPIGFAHMWGTMGGTCPNIFLHREKSSAMGRETWAKVSGQMEERERVRQLSFPSPHFLASFPKYSHRDCTFNIKSNLIASEHFYL